ncbi:hypothetical protein A3Q56_03209 [Intoshia linei]|uniref:SWIM-type domain-containing protein n=1 Tax=Intoshia linei TaxID=1819745 RepID=A0A177B5R4_9BILA|nr:hypothetical protein A3Q56_03209 [Intoshia linei]
MSVQETTYISSESDAEPKIEFKKKRGKAKEWIFLKSVTSNEYQDLKKDWSIRNNKNSRQGLKLYHRCIYFKKSNTNKCEAEMMAHYVSNNDFILIYTLKDHSNHSDEKVRGLSNAQKKYIMELYNIGCNKPKQLITAFKQNHDLKAPPISQVRNYLVKIKSEKLHSYYISLAELIGKCELLKYSEIADQDTPYVLDYKVNIPEKSFILVMTTKRLINLPSYCSNFHADATYKLVWNDFSVFIVGFTDYNRIFHPISICISSEETEECFKFFFTLLNERCPNLDPKYIISDVSSAIRNAAHEVWPNSLWVMSWYHVVINIDKKLKSVLNNEKRTCIRNDIHDLQLSPNLSNFKTACSLFLKKYENDEESRLFMTYFNEQWLTQKNSWYEGFSVHTSSTNNELKSINLQIKREGAFRERLPLDKFLSVICNIIKNWSQNKNHLNDDYKQIALEPTIIQNIWLKAFNTIKDKNSIFMSDDQTICKFRCNPSIKNYEDNFDSFIKISRNESLVKINKDNWKFSSCTCPQYLKIFICHHVVSMALMLKKTNNEEAKDIFVVCTWPNGNYIIPKLNDECIDDMEEETINGDDLFLMSAFGKIKPSHFHQSISVGNITVCKQETEPEIAKEWKRGNYCYLKNENSSCVADFHYGNVRASFGELKYSLFYCCRNDIGMDQISSYHMSFSPANKFYILMQGPLCTRIKNYIASTEYLVFNTKLKHVELTIKVTGLIQPKIIIFQDKFYLGFCFYEKNDTHVETVKVSFMGLKYSHRYIILALAILILLAIILISLVLVRMKMKLSSKKDNAYEMENIQQLSNTNNYRNENDTQNITGYKLSNNNDIEPPEYTG